MLTDDIRAVAVPRLLSSIQSSGMPSAEKKSKTRPFWSYYNLNEIKALYGWEEIPGLTFLQSRE
jgi:hypothetical protein